MADTFSEKDIETANELLEQSKKIKAVTEEAKELRKLLSEDVKNDIITEIELSNQRVAALEAFKNKLIESGQASAELKKRTTDFYEKESAQLEKLTKASDKYVSSTQRTSAMFSKIVGMGGAALTGVAAMKMLGLGTKGKFEDNVSSIVGMIKNPQMELDRLSTSYRRATGQIMNADMASSAQFNDSIIQQQRNLRELGIRVEDVFAAQADLRDSSRAFALIQAQNTEENRKYTLGLRSLALRAERAGLSYRNFGEILDITGKVFRSNNLEGATEDLTEAIIGMGRATGQTADEVKGQLSQSLETLAAYSGPKALNVFKGLSAIAAEAGMNVQELTSAFGDSFDTFEGAAQKTGSLNALLGLQLNSLELMAMSEEERAMTIRDSIQNSGQSFENMGRFMRKAVARQIGMSTEAASKFLQSSTTSIKDIRRLMDAETKDIDVLMGKGADGQKRIGEGAIANAVSITEQIDAMKESAVTLKGVLEGMKTTTQASLPVFGALADKFRDVVAEPTVQFLIDRIAKATGAVNEATVGGRPATTPGKSAPSQFSPTIKVYLDGKEVGGAVRTVIEDIMKGASPMAGRN